MAVSTNRRKERWARHQNCPADPAGQSPPGQGQGSWRVFYIKIDGHSTAPKALESASTSLRPRLLFGHHAPLTGSECLKQWRLRCVAHVAGTFYSRTEAESSECARPHRHSLGGVSGALASPTSSRSASLAPKNACPEIANRYGEPNSATVSKSDPENFFKLPRDCVTKPVRRVVRDQALGRPSYSRNHEAGARTIERRILEPPSADPRASLDGSYRESLPRRSSSPVGHPREKRADANAGFC
jgi:hypothetical protein